MAKTSVQLMKVYYLNVLQTTSTIKTHRELHENKTIRRDKEIRGTKSSVCVKAVNPAKNIIAWKQTKLIDEKNGKF